MGRSPIRQPPRSGMKASPSRCSSGPQSSTGTRDEPAWASMSATCACSTLVGSSSSSPSRSVESIVTPWSSSRPETILTSEISGTLRSRQGPSASRAATMAFETRFLAPRTSRSPTRGEPPFTVRMSAMAQASQRAEEADTPRGVPASGEPWVSGALGGALGRRLLGGGRLRGGRGLLGGGRLLGRGRLGGGRLARGGLGGGGLGRGLARRGLLCGSGLLGRGRLGGGRLPRGRLRGGGLGRGRRLGGGGLGGGRLGRRLMLGRLLGGRGLRGGGLRGGGLGRGLGGRRLLGGCRLLRRGRL